MQYIVRLFPGSPFRYFRNILWRLVKFDIDKSANLAPTATLICTNIYISEKSYVGEYSLLTGGSIFIGKRVDIAPRVIIHAGSHITGDRYRRAGDAYAGEVNIGDGTWIGTGAIILSGTKVGKGSIIAAGSVVKAGEYPPDTMIAGVPARVIKKLP